MKILLDESLPRKLKYDFGYAHEFLLCEIKAGWDKKTGNYSSLQSVTPLIF